MARSASPKGVDRIAQTAIDLIALLSATPGASVSLEEAKCALQVDDEGIRRAVRMIGNLGDRESGARAVIDVAGDELVLGGDAVDMGSRRLTVDEGLVLAEVLDALRLAQPVRDRIGRALLPLGIAREDRAAGFSDTTPYGPAFLALDEAIRYGMRCRISYRSADDPTARERIIDPLALPTEQGTPYLIAWDIERGAQRRYRLDRIEAVAFTEDSVEQHDWTHEEVAESLRGSGVIATLAFASEQDARWRGWAGMGDVSPLPDGRARTEVAVTSKRWLFDQVLASGGSIEILGPGELRAQLAAYARELTL